MYNMVNLNDAPNHLHVNFHNDQIIFFIYLRNFKYQFMKFMKLFIFKRKITDFFSMRFCIDFFC